LWDRLVGRIIDRPVPRLVKDSLALIVFLFAGAGIVAIVFGQSIFGIWATSGAVGIVLGIALRSIILDVFTGLSINFDRSYRIGDWVEIVDRVPRRIRGKVLEINWRTTRLDTDDGRILIVPNSRMGEAILSNLSLQNEVVEFDTRFVLDFSVPRERALRVLLAGVMAARGPKGPLAASPLPKVRVSGVTEIGVEYRITYWHHIETPSESVGRDVVVRSVLRHLANAGLSPAYPKRDTFHADMPSRQLEHDSVDDRCHLLGELEIFASLEPAQLKLVATQMQLRRFPAGDTLMRQGDPGRSMLVLAEGLCEVWISSEESLRQIAVIEPGEFVGEMSLITGERRSATVKATTDVVAYEVASEQLAPILAEQPQLYEAISQMVAERRLRTNARLAQLDADQQSEEIRSASAQILDRMRSFFRSLGRSSAARRRAPAALDNPVGTA
jgi:small-conductance mechanosensitive channel/CRP-like cAMP-binding protein